MQSINYWVARNAQCQSWNLSSQRSHGQNRKPSICHYSSWVNHPTGKVFDRRTVLPLVGQWMPALCGREPWPFSCLKVVSCLSFAGCILCTLATSNVFQLFSRCLLVVYHATPEPCGMVVPTTGDPRTALSGHARVRFARLTPYLMEGFGHVWTLGTNFMSKFRNVVSCWAWPLFAW